MTKEQVFEIWAPPAGRWSPWVKPVLFASMSEQPWRETSALLDDVNLDWLPHVGENVALVFDLPGADGVWAGIAAARKGYRPVPLYNAVAGPMRSVVTPFGIATALIDVASILAALGDSTWFLQSVVLPPDAPPAFLLDANRRGQGLRASPGRFDNRSISFTTDFPSATFLLSHGIRRIVLVQDAYVQPQADLAHTLRRWQDAGISIELKSLDSMSEPVVITVEKPTGFRLLFQRALALFGLRRHGLGGFGGIVPQPSSG